VWFWSNHFCISADKVVAMAGAYEREAIRAHVLGRFADMLGAVERHPAMLFYLDNVQSMGAHSVAGINRDRGLNENSGVCRSGRIVARTGLRMMPTFPRSPLTFRKASFPRYG
jgi:Protein of unknown function (DUF1800)